MTSSTATTPATTTPATRDPAEGWVDARTQIEVGVLLAYGRLVGRRVAAREEAEAFARPEDGEQVVEYNLVCECVV